ncbi:MAG: RNA polymerase sigma factor [bacterium]
MCNQISDEELMSQIKTGNVEAFEVLFNRYRTPIFSFIYRMLGDFHKAQDIFQETFFRMFKDAYRYKETLSFYPWLYRIAHNLCIEEIRRQKKSETIFVNENIKESNEHWNGRMPDKELEDKEIEQILEKAILQLTEKQREVFILREYHELSYEDIAQITSMSIPAVKSCLHRARMALLDILNFYLNYRKK